MSKKEIKEDLNKVSGGFDLNLQKKAEPIKCGKTILDTLPSGPSIPALYYGGPAIRHEKPVATESPEQPVEPLVPANPVKQDDSKISK